MFRGNDTPPPSLRVAEREFLESNRGLRIEPLVGYGAKSRSFVVRRA